MEVQDTSAEPRAEGRRERKKREVELRIRDAAMALFREQGYEATTVEQIAERADVAKGTIFNYFPRKESLLVVVAEEMRAEAFEAMGPRERLVDGGEASLRELFRMDAESVVRDPEFSRTLLSESMRAYWERPDESRAEVMIRDLLIEIVERAKERGEFRRECDTHTIVGLLRAAYFATVVEWLKGVGSGRPLSDELDRKLDIIFAGLRSGEAG